MTKKVSKLKTQARDLNSDFLISVEILSLLIGGPYQKFRSEDGCVISGFMGCSGSGFEAGMHQSGGFSGCIRVVVQRFRDAASGYNLHPAPHPQPDAPHPSLPIPQDFMFLNFNCNLFKGTDNKMFVQPAPTCQIFHPENGLLLT